MMRVVAAAVCALVLLSSALRAQWDRRDYTETRNATVNAAGASLVRVDAGAGLLRIEGRPGLSSVEIEATARASERGWLQDIRLEARRQGDEVLVRVVVDDDRRHHDGSLGMDLVIRVPRSMTLDVEDGSGEVDISNVASLRLEDGSGSLTLTDIGGNVTLRDGSGDIEIRNVTGSVLIESDGSGGILIDEVRGSVTVRDDGSGDVRVARVGGDFQVLDKGSGDIRFNSVGGNVRIPERSRRSRSRDARSAISIGPPPFPRAPASVRSR